MRSRILGIALGLALAAPALVPAPAFAGWTDHVGYKRQGSVCTHDDDVTTDIGGGFMQKELGKHGVVQFKVVWKLYNTNPKNFGGPKAKKTMYSTSFPDDNRNFFWDWNDGAPGGGGNWVQWNDLSGAHEYWLHAKMVWIRKGALRNWSYTLPVAYCGAHTP